MGFSLLYIIMNPWSLLLLGAERRKPANIIPNASVWLGRVENAEEQIPLSISSCFTR